VFGGLNRAVVQQEDPNLAKVDKTARQTHLHCLLCLQSLAEAWFSRLTKQFRGVVVAIELNMACRPPPEHRSSLFPRSFRLPEGISRILNALILPEKCPSLD
jgi:hypothetical protein